MEALKIAVDTAKKNSISTMVVASTTGNTASELLNMAGLGALRIIVVTHDEGKPLKERRFNDEIRQRLLAKNITVYTHSPSMILLRKILREVFNKLGLSLWQKHLVKIRERYGTGIKVCHIILQMLIESRRLSGGKVVAVAGTKKGADSVAIFRISPHNKWPILEEVVMCHK